jgi:hypothetical protein
VGKFFENWLEGSEKNFPRGGEIFGFSENSAPLNRIHEKKLYFATQYTSQIILNSLRK